MSVDGRWPSEVAASLDALSQLLHQSRFDQFIHAETDFYLRHIRSIEAHAHHESMFKLVDPIVAAYGSVIKSQLNDTPRAALNNSVCYFLPNLDNDLAHIELLTTILKARDRNRDRPVFIAGFAQSRRSIGSRNIAMLSNQYGIPVIVLPASHQGVLQFCDWFLRGGIGLLVAYSIPTLLSCWLEVFGGDRVAWFITKFELESFSALRFGISAAGTRYEIIQRHKVRWWRVPASLPESYKFSHSSERRGSLRLVSINREEKLRDVVFLEAVSSLLIANPDAVFHWTGRAEDANIVGFFRARGLSERQKFIGWVDPAAVLPTFDVFLDTFGLSGIVAASAFASGMPTMFMRSSGSWLEAFEGEAKLDISQAGAVISENIDQVLGLSSEDYVRKSGELIARWRAGNFDGAWQREFGDKWFFDAARAFGRHDRAISEILVEARL